MTPDEHLDCILAFIDRALATCAKRTPGEWEIKPAEVHRDYLRIRGGFLGGRYKIANVCGTTMEGSEIRHIVEEPKNNADFIANASIGYEAALRSTKAAIQQACWQISYADESTHFCAKKTLTAIRAAWPIEKLK